jgi:carbon storage regulator
MLVLSRRKDESVIIGDEISVTIVEIRGDKVRLGIEHPRDVPVHRWEVYEAIRHEDALQREQSSSSELPTPGTAHPDASPATAVAAAARRPITSSLALTGSSAGAPASLLDRIAGALCTPAQPPLTRDRLTQAIAEAAVQALSTEIVRSMPPEQVKSLLLQALQSRG